MSVIHVLRSVLLRALVIPMMAKKRAAHALSLLRDTTDANANVMASIGKATSHAFSFVRQRQRGQASSNKPEGAGWAPHHA